MRDFIESKIARVPEAGCWLWLGGISDKGYGRLKVNGKNKMAHRVAYEEFVGEIPSGLTIDHLCRVRCCVNPAHLEPVTNRENVLRGVGPTAINARQTHCVHGHLLEGQNLRPRRESWRICRTCYLVSKRLTDAKRRARLRAEKEKT